MPRMVNVPVLPESVSEATVLEWHKQAGETVAAGDILVDLETDKIVLEVPAPMDGIVAEILQPAGATVASGQPLARLEELNNAVENAGGVAVAALPPPASPAARKLARAHDVAPEQVAPQGERLTTADVQRHIEQRAQPVRASAENHPPAAAVPYQEATPATRRAPMSRLRQRAAERLLAAQHNHAILTTFNEIHLHHVMQARQDYREAFLQKHGVKLGLMSFFVKATGVALAKFPILNAAIDGEDIVYHDNCDIGIAVSTPRGLVVPILRNAQTLGFAQIEQAIADFGQRAKNGKLTLEELQGGTFTITNGGVFGSMLSTPILNPPQSAILGMHNIVERPVAEQGQVVIRPVMYVALSYDHRLIDGRDAVQFLVTIKQLLESPIRLLLDI